MRNYINVLCLALNGYVTELAIVESKLHMDRKIAVGLAYSRIPLAEVPYMYMQQEITLYRAKIFCKFCMKFPE